MLDLLLCQLLLAGGIGLPVAHSVAFATAILTGSGLGSVATRRQLRQRWPLDLVVIAVLAYLLRAMLVTALADRGGWFPELAVVPGIAATALVGLFSVARTRTPAHPVEPVFRWETFILCAIGYALVLRFIIAGAIDLLPEESYYWAYARNLDLGYLDHPPMVAWLIRLGTWLLGNDELGVRLPALGCWAVAAVFLFRLAGNLYGRTTAIQTLLLFSVLPIYFSAGLVMTPDAPLHAAWAASLYFLERALVAGRRLAWLGAGVSLGLGLLSKYTIALLGPAALIYVLLDEESRRWLKRPEPYLAAGLAALVFSPTIAWNAAHHWASFRFQGPERWSAPVEFSLHLLLGEVLLLLTPVGLLGVAAALSSRWSLRTGAGAAADARRRFALVFTLAPLTVFLLYALHGQPKLNWTGPVWLAALPLLAWHLDRLGDPARALRWNPFGRRLWGATVIATLLLYGGCFHYVQLGLPGLSLTGSMSVPVAWNAMARDIEQISGQVRIETGSEPLIVGMDKYFISSQFAFYDPDRDGFEETSGRHLFDGDSLMWAYWHPASAARGRNVVLIAFTADRLSHESVSCRFRQLGPVTTHAVVKHGNDAAHFYARVGYRYDPEGAGCS